MTREEKNIEIESLAKQFTAYPNFYITNVDSLNSVKTSKLRRLCYSKNVKLRVAKNNLIKQALLKLDASAYEGLFPALKGAWIDSSIFLGDNQLDALINLKSKNELIADVIALLQSPAKNVVSQLQSSGQKLVGILKTLEEKGS